MSFVTIAVQCHNYQRRLCWMLSSLCHQSQPDLVAVDIAYLTGNGTPATESLIDFYGQRMPIRGSAYTDLRSFQKRGYTRNRQLRQCTTDWILFADCDMVYHPEYFWRLGEELLSQHATATHMLSSGRWSTEKEPTNTLVNRTISTTPELIPDAFQQVTILPKARRRNVGAGFSQLINMHHAPHAGFYVESGKSRDWSWNRRYHKTRSDIQFRKRMNRLGGRRQSLPEWFTDGLIHLNHERDNEVKYHLETQR